MIAMPLNQSDGANRLILRKRRPKRMNNNGIGTIMVAKQPNNVPAHWLPRLLNICRVNSGKLPPTKDRIIVLAAKADAALLDG